MLSNKSEKFQRDDLVYLAKRKELSEKLGIENLWSVVDHFGLYAGIQTLGTRLAVFEIMKESLHVPGHIAEFGCWKGSNLLFMAKVLQLLQPNTFKHIYGFDSFEGLQAFSMEDKVGMREMGGEYKGDEEQLKVLIEFFNLDEWVHLVKGNALETIPAFEKECPHLLFSFIYIDFDLYAPSKAALEFAGRRLLPGGIIAFDEALTHYWPGEGQALAEFLADCGTGKYTAHHVAFARQPTVYLVKK